jgi:hypothetical protein
MLNDVVKAGGHLFPLRFNSKLPAVKDWAGKAKGLWLDEAFAQTEHGSANYGLCTEEFGENEALIAVDVDVKNGKDGMQSLLELNLEGKEFPKTYTQYTPSGGLHIIYKAPAAIKQGVDVLGPGIDIRSRGGYVVLSGSKIDDKLYTDNGEAIADAPDWLIQLGAASAAQTVVDFDPTAVFKDEIALRVRHYLTNHAEKIEQRGGTNNLTLKVACKVKDMGAPIEMAVALMKEWNNNNPIHLSNEEIALTTVNAYKYGRNQFGSDMPEAYFKPIKPGKDEKSGDPIIDKLNAEWAFVLSGGDKPFVREKKNAKGGIDLLFYNKTSFTTFYANATVAQGTKKISYAEYWIAHPKRRSFTDIVFKPNDIGLIPTEYNTWHGFACEPLEYNEASELARKGFDDWCAHVYENICSFDEPAYQWLLQYFATIIQHPETRCQTAVVLKGEKGTGKNAFLDRFGALLGAAHYDTYSNERYLTSNFNSHMEGKLALVFDEMVWSADKGANGVLKSLITSPTANIERKGAEIYSSDSYVRIFIVSNENWVVPATADERRYCVFQVSSAKIRDTEFFENMRINMDIHGGRRILMHFLANYEIKNPELIKIPIASQALQDQKMESLKGFGRFWYEIITDGYFPSLFFSEKEWPEKMESSMVKDHYIEYARRHNIRSWIPTSASIHDELKLICPSMAIEKVKTGKTELTMFNLPTIEQARADWHEYYKEGRHK